VENGGTVVDGINFMPGTNSWTHENGWNAGGGASLAFGRTEVFVEARNIQFNNDIAPTARQIPIVLGVNWY